MSTADRHTLMRRLTSTIDSLAYPYSHTEIVETTHQGRPHRYRHITRQAPLITQLATHTKDQDGPSFRGRPAYESCEPVPLHAIDRHAAIESECLAWLRHMGVPARATLTGCLGALVGGAGRLDTETLGELVASARAWWCWARTVTGWDSPPWRPWGPCPVCTVVGSVRVRESARTAVCVSCWATWDNEAIGRLAAYIRLWSQSQRTSKAAA